MITSLPIFWTINIAVTSMYHAEVIDELKIAPLQLHGYMKPFCKKVESV